MSTNAASRKPRQLRGTPSYRIRNYVAVGVIAAGTALFFGVYALINDPLKNAKIQKYFQMTDEEKDRRALMSFIQPKRGEEIAKMMEELDALKRTK